MQSEIILFPVSFCVTFSKNGRHEFVLVPGLEVGAELSQLRRGWCNAKEIPSCRGELEEKTRVRRIWMRVVPSRAEWIHNSVRDVFWYLFWDGNIKILLSLLEGSWTKIFETNNLQISKPYSYHLQTMPIFLFICKIKNCGFILRQRTSQNSTMSLPQLYLSQSFFHSNFNSIIPCHLFFAGVKCLLSALSLSAKTTPSLFRIYLHHPRTPHNGTWQVVS